MTEKIHETPAGRAAWERFDRAVEQCRRLEARFGLTLWAFDRTEIAWPPEYKRAVDEWDRARILRNELYEAGR